MEDKDHGEQARMNKHPLVARVTLMLYELFTGADVLRANLPSPNPDRLPLNRALYRGFFKSSDFGGYPF